MIIDPFATFAPVIAELSPRHPRRLAITLAQIGLFVAVACFPISIAGMNIGLVTCLVGCVFAGAPLHRCVGFWFYITFVAWIGLSMLLAETKNNWISSASIPIGLLVAQIVLHPQIPGAERYRKWIVNILLVAVTAAAILALAQYIIGKGGAKPLRIDPDGPRFFQSTGFFGLQLTQGAVMGMLCLLLGGLVTQAHGWWGRAGQIVAALGVAISGARAAWLGFAAALSFSVASRGKRYFWIAGGIGISLLLIAGLVLKVTQPERLNRMLAMEDGRWPIWRTSLAIIADNPLLGAGGSRGYRNAYLEAYPQVAPNIPNEFPDGAPHAHNTQLSQAAEFGIPLAIIWLAMLGWVLWHLRHGNPSQFRAGVGMAAMALVFGQFENLDGESSRVLWTGLGMLLALSCEKSAETNLDIPSTLST